MLTHLKRIYKLFFVTIGYILTAVLIQCGTKIADCRYVRIWSKSIAAYFKVLTVSHIKSFTQSRK